MSDILLPIAVLEGETVPPGLIDFLAPVEVTILGYHVVPEQTPPDQARLQFEDRAVEALTDLCDAFQSNGVTADHRLVFTHDEEQSIDRIAAELDARAIAIPGVTGEVEDLLVALSGKVAIDRILSFTERLVGDRPIRVTLFLASAKKADQEKLNSAQQRLEAAGVDVETRFTESHTPTRALVGALEDYDVTVIGERADSFRSLVFGDESDWVASASIGPVLVVRHRESQEG